MLVAGGRRGLGTLHKRQLGLHGCGMDMGEPRALWEHCFPLRALVAHRRWLGLGAGLGLGARLGLVEGGKRIRRLGSPATLSSLAR